jgi:hypothetical protein
MPKPTSVCLERKLAYLHHIPKSSFNNRDVIIKKMVHSRRCTTTRTTRSSMRVFQFDQFDYIGIENQLHFTNT